MVDVPGSAGLVLVAGVAHLDEEGAVFEAMLTGWGRQQGSRLLGQKTITDRLRLVRRFTEFAECYPWGLLSDTVGDHVGVGVRHWG